MNKAPISSSTEQSRQVCQPLISKLCFNSNCRKIEVAQVDNTHQRLQFFSIAGEQVLTGELQISAKMGDEFDVDALLEEPFNKVNSSINIKE